MIGIPVVPHVENARLRSRLLLLVRIALCATALAYVFSRTNVHDSVKETIGGRPVRLISLQSDYATVVVDETVKDVPLDSLEKQEDGSIRINWGLASLATRSNKTLFALALLIFGIQPVLQIVRFRWMLRLQGIEADWSSAAAVCFIGNFYSYVIPGTTGGDIVRAGYLMRGSTNRHGALVAIGLDRLTGMAGMFALAALAGLLIPDARDVVRHVAMVAGAAVVVMITGFASITGWPAVSRLLTRLPLGEHLQLLYEAVSVGQQGWLWLAAGVGLTVILQGGSMVAFSVAAVALGMEPAWSTYLVCLPVSLVVAAIPIVPMGLGTMEAAMMTLLAGQVGSASQVLGLAFAMRIIGLLWALPGGLLSLVWTPGPAVTSSSDR